MDNVRGISSLSLRCSTPLVGARPAQSWPRSLRADFHLVSWRLWADTSRTQLFQSNGSKHRLYKFHSSLDPVKKNIPKAMKNVAFFHGLGPRVSFVQQAADEET
jgi:hypothetical protein